MVSTFAFFDLKIFFKLGDHLTESFDEVPLLITFVIVEFKHVYLVFELREI